MNPTTIPFNIELLWLVRNQRWSDTGARRVNISWWQYRSNKAHMSTKRRKSYILSLFGVSLTHRRKKVDIIYVVNNALERGQQWTTKPKLEAPSTACRLKHSAELKRLQSTPVLLGNRSLPDQPLSSSSWMPSKLKWTLKPDKNPKPNWTHHARERGQ